VQRVPGSSTGRGKERDGSNTATPTFMAVGESPLLPGLNADHPQVIVVDKGQEGGGSPEEILGSMLVPEHWVLISTGFMEDTC
jgi:hypothetical protein